eukprot:scaffold13965_cov33-Phaeocystis_antarctica.AAC.1
MPAPEWWWRLVHMQHVEVVKCEKTIYRTENATCPSSWSSGEAPTANLIAKAAKSMDTFDLVSKERESGKAGGIEGTRYF